MNTLGFYPLGVSLAALVQLALAFYIVHKTRGPLGVLWHLVRMPTSPIDKVGQGPAEVEGTLEPLDEPFRATDGRPCVLIHTEVTSTWRNEQRQRQSSHTDHREGSRALLRDASGACLVLLDDAIVLGATRVFQGPAAAARGARPELVIPHLAETVTLTERSIEAGSRVLVSAMACEPGDLAPEIEGYRKAPLQRWLLRGDERRRLLIAVGPQRSLLWALGKPIALPLLLAAGCALHGAALLWWAAL